MDFKQLKMDSKQQAIYDGLKSWRPEIAAFYKDGLSVLASDYESKSNIVAHLLREIDSGLRDMFKISSPVEEPSKENNEQHKKSIMRAFGLPKDSKLFDMYFNAVKKSAELAHRSSKAIDGPRDPKEIENLWDTFEEALLQLIGSYIASTRLLNGVLQMEKPNKDIMRRLHIVLGDDGKKVYFYNNLNKIGWLSPLFDKGFFDCENNPEPIEAPEHPGAFMYPYWTELNYVERITPLLSEADIQEWRVVLAIINRIIKYRKEDGTRIANPRTDNTIYYLISLLPEEQLRVFDLAKIEELIHSTGTFFADNFLKKFFPRCLQIGYKEGALFCLRMAFNKIDNKDRYPQYVHFFESYEVKHIMTLFKEQLSALCGIEGFSILLDLISETKDDANYLLIHTLEEDDNQNRYRDYYTDNLLFFTLHYLKLLPTKDVFEVSKSLLNSGNSVFMRIAYHIIDKRYDELSEVLWEYEQNPVNDSFCYPELYRLFYNNREKFSQVQIQKCIEWIDTFTTELEFDGVDKVMVVNHYKKSVAMAFSDLGNGNMDTFLRKLTELYPKEIEHPGYSSYMSVGFAKEAVEPSYNISGMTIPQISELYKREQTEVADAVFGGHLYELNTEFQGLIKEQIFDYTAHCDDMVTAPVSMQNEWIWGLLRYLDDAPRINNSVKVFQVLGEIISKEEFWERYREESRLFGEYHKFVKSLLMLITKVQVRYYTSFPLDTVYCIFSILYQIDRKAYDEYENNWDGSFQYFANNLSFSIYDNVIRACYIEAHEIEDKSQSQWNKCVKSDITSKLALREENPSFFHVLGIKLNDLYYVDRDWCSLNYPTIFSGEIKENNKAALYGFLLDHPLACREIFEYLYQKGSLNEILSDSESFDGTIVTFIVQYLLEAFRIGILDETAVSLLIGSNNETIYRHIISYFSRLKGDRRYQEIAKYVWAQIYNSCKDLDSEAHKSIIRDSYYFIDFFDSIDSEIEEWILLSAKNNKENHFYHFISIILRLLEVNTEIIGKIVFELVKNANYLYHPELTNIISQLYVTGYKDLANSICEEAIRKRHYEFNVLYEKYNIL